MSKLPLIALIGMFVLVGCLHSSPPPENGDGDQQVISVVRGWTVEGCFPPEGAFSRISLEVTQPMDQASAINVFKEAFTNLNEVSGTFDVIFDESNLQQIDGQWNLYEGLDSELGFPVNWIIEDNRVKRTCG